MQKIRTRFAPSPTGYLHIGSLRTVLFNYLISKSLDGKLILRIEDTDAKREVKGAVNKLIEILNWLGIKFDEGPLVKSETTNFAHPNDLKEVGKFAPYIQSKRLEIYQKYVKKLLEKKQAYYCFCTSERLIKMRDEQQKLKKPPRYEKACRNLSQEEIEKRLKLGKKYVIRQKMPLDGDVVVNDELRGEIKFKAKDIEDHVLIKSNRVPTYQFASVVDDHLMEISHVVRGEEWIPSFPKNILLYQAFGWLAPKFIHLPLTLNKEGGKLSKRQGDVAVEDFKLKGYLPEALINYSILLGWHPKGDNEVFSLEEAIKQFKIKDMNISPAIFDTTKLDFLNGFYIRKMDIDNLVELCKPYLKDNLNKTKDNSKKKDKYIKNVIALSQERLKKLSEIGELTDFFFTDKLDYQTDLLVWKKMSLSEVKNNLEEVCGLLEKISEKDWKKEKIEKIVIEYLKTNNKKIGEYLWPLRVALTNKAASPGPFEVAEVLGKKESLIRINKAVKKL
ncbi:MAG: glutamate--tRNA ligase [Patescibacteria group bacterium]